VSELGYTLAYGIVAAFSPTVLVATLIALGSGRGRLNGSVFLLSFLVGQSVAYLIGFLVGSAFTIGENLAGNVVGALEVAAGIALVSIAWRRRSVPLDRAGPPRSQAVFARLERVSPRVSLGVGFPLGVGAKRLVITFLAATSVASAGLARDEEVALGILYVVVATVVVWCPVVVYLIVGARADRLVADTRIWITTHESQLLVVTAVTLGLVLIADGLLQLL
jgi:small neutral amino acid transporter SnatA (MarC family)